jgi:hypothetical protein
VSYANKTWALWGGLGLALALAGCGKDAESKAGPCGRGELEGCGAACSAASVCPSGLHCAQGACTAECSSDQAASDCGDGQVCSSSGQCESDSAAEDGGENEDAGRIDAGHDAGSDSGGGLDSSRMDGGDVCGEVMLSSTPKTPNVMLIIDQSSSMSDNPLGDTNRWDALRNALLASDGLISDLQHVVRFGATFYSAMPGGPSCPQLTEVGMAIDNFDAIQRAYPANTIKDTPTGDAIEAVLQELQQPASGLDPLSSEDPTIFILATDGEPDRCEEPDGDGRQEAIDAVKHAFSLGIRTYVIAVANEQDLSQGHVNDLANAGVGNMGGTQAPSYRVNSDQGLRMALREIVGGVLTCAVKLKGTVTGDACDADVRIGSQMLTCDEENGYQLVDPSTIQLNGAACEKLKDGEQLTATFPCGAAIPI